ncbi:hypothetical protein T03_13588 [Trichinella britovi]|uniref:Uncharacterized protein n=1 Tax=Trichinella britovi TaxID=45882 RepID=A0A0V1C624_TRIBR|nr:hypothetical protein T03_13588 [Trichinella britovi]
MSRRGSTRRNGARHLIGSKIPEATLNSRRFVSPSSGGSYLGVRTSSSLRHASNKFLTSSRAGRLPLSCSSPLGGLRGRLAHLRSLNPPEVNKDDNWYTKPLGAWTHNSAWRAITRSPWPGRVHKSV